MSESGTQTVRVELTVDDLRQFYARPVQKMLRPSWPWVLIATLLAGAVLLRSGGNMQGDPLISVLIYGLVPIFLFVLVFVRIYTYVMPAKLACLPYLVAPTEIVMTPAHLTFENSLTNGLVKWPAIESVEEGKKHIFLLLGTGMGYIVPKRSFATPEAAQRFLEAAGKYWQAAHDKT